MKKLYQRILSMALSLSMLLSMAVTAGATDENGVVNDAGNDVDTATQVQTQNDAGTQSGTTTDDTSEDSTTAEFGLSTPDGKVIYSLDETATITVSGIPDGATAYYTTDGTNPTTSSRTVSDGEITVSAPADQTDGGTVTVKVGCASGDESNMTYSTVAELTLSFYRTTEAENSVFSLEVNDSTYYFSDAVSAFTAGNDVNLTGNMKLSVLKSNTEENAYGYSSEAYFSQAESLEFDLGSCSLFLKNNGDNVIALNFDVDDITISGSDSTNATLTLVNGTLYGNAVTEIKNVSIIGKYTLNFSSYLVGKSNTMMNISGAKLEVQSDGENSGYVLYAYTTQRDQSYTISNSEIRNEKGNCIFVSGGRAGRYIFSLIIENSSLVAGVVALDFPTTKKSVAIASTNSDYTAPQILNSTKDTSEISIAINGGKFTGSLFGGETVAFSATIKNGSFSQDPSSFENVTSDNTEKTYDENSGLWIFTELNSVDVTVEKTGFGNAATITNDSVAYPGNDLIFTIELLPDMYIDSVEVTETDSNGSPQDLDSNENGYGLTYSEDKLSAQYKMKVPENPFTITFNVCVEPSLTEDVAKIGDEKYKSLSAALASLSDNCEITLLKDVTYPAQMTITQKNFTLDLNNHTLTMKYDSPTEYGIILRDTSLTVTDAEGGSGVISFSSMSKGIDVTGIESGSVFTLNGGTLKDIEAASGVATALSTENSNNDPKSSRIIINNGIVYGQTSVFQNEGYLELNGGKLYAAGGNAAAVSVGYNSSFKMTGGEVYSHNDIDIGDGAIYLSIDEKSKVEISGGKIEATNGVSAVAIINGVESGEITFSGTAELISTSAAALNIGCALNENDLKILLDGNVKYDGATYAIYITESEAAGGYYKALPKIEIKGGQFACGDEYILISDTSSVVFVDDTYVLNTREKANGAKYLSLVTKDSLAGTYYPNEGTQLNPIPYSYQDFEGNRDGSGQGLDDLLDQAKQIHDAGNSDSQYPTESWNTFERAYEMALRVRSNTNANQDEIDFRSKYLASGLRTLDSVQGLDLDSLLDGTYTIEVEMWKYNLSSHSMSNDAIDPTATLIKSGDTWRLQLYFKPINVTNVWGHLEDFYIYKGDSLSDGEVNQKTDTTGNNMSVKTEATYIEWYKGGQSSLREPAPEGVEVGKGTEYCYPGIVEVTLPYCGIDDEKCYYWVGMNVDAMGGYATAILRLSWSTLEAVDVEDTLSLDTTEVSLLNGGTQTVNAEVLGADGYTLSVNSDNTDAATATIENDDISITAVGAGTANITVTATKGDATLTKTITVTVAGDNETAVKAETSVSGSAATATISGDVLVTAGGDGSVEVGSTVTVNAKAETGNTITSAAVTIEASAAEALAGSKKDVEIQTNMGSVTLDAALMQQVANAEGDVVLTVQNGTLPSGTTGNFTETYELALTANGTAVDFSGGQATVTVPTTLTSNGYAYCIGSDGAKTDWQYLAVSDGYGTWTTTHFSTWALSANEYNVDSGSDQEGGGEPEVPEEEEYFLSDGNYYVDIDLYKENENTESMGNVAFKNNDRALVTVEDGEITTVQIATNPVDVSGYHSAITSFDVDDTSVSVLDTGSLTTSFNDEVIQSGYTYVKLVEFTMPSAGQPEYADEVTYVYVTFYVPDTPMDEVVDAESGLRARIRFDWSSASATSDSSLEQDDSSAAGTSSITGEEIVDVDLVDKDTGIKLSTDSERLSDTATLSVEKLTSGSDYDTAVKAMSGVTDSWILYNITALVDGEVTAPEGSVTLSIPCTKEGLTVYRINASGTKTVLKGEVKDGYYVLNTSSLGLFAIVGVLGEARELPFTDVETGSWYYDGVKYAVEKGLFAGTSATTFAPNMELTRAMLVTVLYRLAGSPEVSQFDKFSDVQADSWYEDAVTWAAANGVVAGYGGGVFGPDDDITREQLAVILYRYAQLTEQNVDTETDLTAYADAGEVSDFAREAMVWAVENGLISGTSATTLSPKGTATRAQVAVILMRYLERLNK